MKKHFDIVLIIIMFNFIGCGSPANNKSEEVKIKSQIEYKLQPKNNTINDPASIEKYTETQILNLIVGKYIASECTFELHLFKQNKKLNYQIKTAKRNIKGVAKISIDQNDGYVSIIFPIEWDDYQGDMTQDTYEPDKEEKPQEVYMSFFTESKTFDFQNYGNAMNNYIIFDECDVKSINLKREKSNL